ncbi:MAG: glycerol-3-phosphate 1-O-acyltransferase PlsY [Endomicrobium sp.]|jgi:glycerol-3-phosphate acyltransferase PlsY|nr:glycerol-3-phosphate 1-O-acyltransferase PlsY [Endomicrobium sp.]
MLIKFLYLAFAYLCGAVPFAYIIAKFAGNVDIRTVGSGNPGATNVFRVVGKKSGAATFVLDVLKGFLPVYFAFYIDNSFSYSAAAAACVLAGHMYTVFLKFKGGKGVAAGLGAFLALFPLPAVIAFAVFIIALVLSGYVALGSIIAALSLPIVTFYSGYPTEAVVFAFAAAVLIIYKHRTNIARLRAGTENKFKIFKRRK